MSANLLRMLNFFDEVGLTTDKIRELEVIIRRKELKLGSLKTELIKNIRDELHKAGITANELSDLKSGSGLPFEKKESKELESDTYLVKTAKTSRSELAYYCKDSTGFSDNGCGWVMGSPEERISEAGRLIIGRNGYSCRICGQPIGGFVLK